MSPARILPLFITGVMLLAEPASNRVAEGQELKVGIWRRELPEMGLVTTGVLTAGKDAYLFMPPANWEMGSDAGSGIRFIGSNQSSISIRVVPVAGQKSTPPAIEELRLKAQRRLPEAKVVSETTCHTEGQSGPAFDLDWKDEQGVQFKARIAYIEVGGRCFEFTLLVPAAQFGRDLGTFMGFMTSFQAAESRSDS